MPGSGGLDPPRSRKFSVEGELILSPAPSGTFDGRMVLLQDHSLLPGGPSSEAARSTSQANVRQRSHGGDERETGGRPVPLPGRRNRLREA
jgi:hypothetical protein